MFLFSTFQLTIYLNLALMFSQFGQYAENLCKGSRMFAVTAIFTQKSKTITEMQSCCLTEIWKSDIGVKFNLQYAKDRNNIIIRQIEELLRRSLVIIMS